MALKWPVCFALGLQYFVLVDCTNCPDTWVRYQGSCYMFGYKLARTFVQAEDFCRQQNAHLVHIEDNDENVFLLDYINRLKVNSFWIGLSDDNAERNWEWYDTHNRANFTDWYPGEPNNSHHNEDCAAFYMTHGVLQWNDLACSEKHEPLCEIRRQGPDLVG